MVSVYNTASVFTVVYNKYINARPTQQSNVLHLPAIRMETARRSFYYHGSTVFHKYSKCT